MERAYVDESEPGGGLDHTSYVLAAVVVVQHQVESARDAVRSATPSRMRKLHWYEALRMQRISWLDLLAVAAAVLVVRYDGAPARAERRRRACLERLVWELETRGVRHVVLESRGTSHDAADRSMLDALRRRGIGRSVRYEHVRGTDEPLVALADLACGAYASGLHQEIGAEVVVVRRGNPTYRGAERRGGRRLRSREARTARNPGPALAAGVSGAHFRPSNTRPTCQC